MSESLIALSYAETVRLRRHLRLLSGSPEVLEFLLSPDITDSALETWLQTPANLTAFQQLISSPSGAAAMCASGTAMTAVTGSRTALTSTIAASSGRNALVASLLAHLLPALDPAMPENVGQHTATLLPDGRVLVTGGNSNGGNSAVRSAARILNTDGTWATATSLPAARRAHTATLLPDGRVLVTGGHDGSSVRAECWIGTISGTTITWQTATSLPGARHHHTATLLPDGRVLVTGGHDGSNWRAECWIGTISGTTITWQTATSLPGVRYLHTATLLPDGRVLVTGGTDGSNVTRAECWIGTISGTTITWQTATSLPGVRHSHTATLLPDGRVLVTGGYDSSAAIAACWIGTISGTTITWQTATSLPAGRWVHTATLRNGWLTLAGGATSADWQQPDNRVITGYFADNSTTIHWRQSA